MLEVEAKMRVSSIENLKNELEKRGAKLVEQKIQVDKVFGRDEDLDENNKIIEGRFSARIRKVNDKCRVDFKEILRGQPGDEHNIDVVSIEDGDKFLKAIGFVHAFTSGKTRWIFKYKDFKICLDDFPKLGFFMEAEKDLKKGESKSEGYESCVKILKEIEPKGEIEEKKYGDLIQEIINKEGSF